MFHHVAVEADSSRTAAFARLFRVTHSDLSQRADVLRTALLTEEAAQSLRGGARPEEGPGWREGLRWVEGWFGPGPGKVPGFGKFVSFFDLKNL